MAPVTRITELSDVPVEPYRFAGARFHGGIAASHAVDMGRMRGGGGEGGGFRDVPGDLVMIPGRKGLFGLGADPEVLSGRYLWGGPMWNHFGHFFVDCIHRLWALKSPRRSYDGIVFAGVQNLVGVNSRAQLAAVQPPKMLAELMDLLDMPKVRVVMIGTPTLIRRLDVPVAGTAMRAPIKPFYRDWLERYQAGLEDKLAVHVRRAPERLYLGRSHLLKKGGFLGCSYFEAALRRAGFLSFTPEGASLGMQLGYLLGARSIVADEGSALHPAQVLSRLDAEVLMFPRRPRSEVYETAFNQRGRFSVLIPPEDVVSLPDRYGGTTSPGTLGAYRHPERAWQRLAERGLVEGRFDAEAFHAAERADLEAGLPRTAAVRRTRSELLDALRG